MEVVEGGFPEVLVPESAADGGFESFGLGGGEEGDGAAAEAAARESGAQ